MIRYFSLIFIVFSFVITSSHAAKNTTEKRKFTQQAPVRFEALTSTIVQNTGQGSSVVKYRVTNQLKHTYTFAMKQIAGVTQLSNEEYCANPFSLAPKASCILALNINIEQLSSFDHGPQVCMTNAKNQPGSFMCAQPSPHDALKIVTTDPAFPYGSSPTGNVCVSSDYYATPETMLGSWAMLQAVDLDAASNVLPSFLNASNVVYAVGTAAIGNELGISQCGGGCNQLNGYCFALKFNNKESYPFMIFQSVNIGANDDSFDIYLAGGGSGAFPEQCAEFWQSGDSINWANHIEGYPCEAYFGDYSAIQSTYSVTYNGVAHPAKETLQNACSFASAGQSGFNTQNWSNVTVVPVTCPKSLTQVTGLALPSTITTVGNKSIVNLNSLTENDFTQSTITGITTTQMQDCKTPSSGYCNNVSESIPNYQASISASLTAPLLTGAPPSNTYCQNYPGTSYCSWDNGNSSGGGSYCNANSAQCIACGNNSKWCICNGSTLQGCMSGIIGG